MLRRCRRKGDLAHAPPSLSHAHTHRSTPAGGLHTHPVNCTRSCAFSLIHSPGLVTDECTHLPSSQLGTVRKDLDLTLFLFGVRKWD